MTSILGNKIAEGGCSEVFELLDIDGRHKKSNLIIAKRKFQILR